MERTEAEATALLVSAVRGYGRRERALRLAGSAAAVLAEPERYAAALRPEDLSALRRAEREGDALLSRLRGAGVRLLLPQGPGSSPLLREIAHPPHLLFCLGAPELGDPFPIACVGTRKASAYGIRNARRIAAELAGAGCCIVSGLAEGIDSAGHEGALSAGGRTIAVLGGALDRLYPKSGRPLMERILAAGGTVLSEYPPGTSPTRFSFLDRNRIISGLSLGVFVAEGRARSGALSTASQALSQGREVFALPGSVEEPCSELPHRLISEGAKLVTCGSDILSEFVIGREPEARRASSGKRPPAPETAPAGTGVAAPAPAEETPAQVRTLRVPEGMYAERAAVCRVLCGGIADFDQLSEETGIPGGALGALLIEMELDGLAETLPGNAFGPGPAMRS